LFFSLIFRTVLVYSLPFVLSDQKGTVVEKLTEETLRDKGHLLELLAVCEGMETEFCFLIARNRQHLLVCFSSSALILLVCGTAQRQIGETALNETSSRSHQILRLVGTFAILNDVQIFRQELFFVLSLDMYAHCRP
jgi:hypothetical protein